MKGLTSLGRFGCRSRLALLVYLNVGLFTTFSRASSRCTGVAGFGRPWLSEFSGVVLICSRHFRSSVTGFIAHKPEGLLKPVSAQGSSLFSVMGWETGE